MAATIPTNGLGVDAGLDIAGGNLTFTTADKGVHLGVTSATAANLMDDYEEGTWTPTFQEYWNDVILMQLHTHWILHKSWQYCFMHSNYM